jgi:alkanesulfonate monooxygenase SsuD/methylene tetrahydromethanopterin reductase-like flavin-dependent oxidoreductase (luciferase family)
MGCPVASLLHLVDLAGCDGGDDICHPIAAARARDLGHPLAEAYHAIVDQVLAAEHGRLDLVGIQDHPYQRRFLDTFSLIADLLARTDRLRFFPDVASLPMRAPAMLAKAATSLDVMSGGRFELGIGAGTFWDAIRGMGGEVRRSGERGDALEEAIRIIRAALDVGAERAIVRGSGPHYPVPGYPAGPPTAHRVEIWVGAMAPRALELIGRLADGWVAGDGLSHVDQFPSLTSRIDEAAAAAGRDPSSIRRIVNASGDITDGARGAGPLDGPVDQWVNTIAHLALDLGIDGFIFWPADPGTSQVARFAAEVAPAAREALGQPGSGMATERR